MFAVLLVMHSHRAEAQLIAPTTVVTTSFTDSQNIIDLWMDTDNDDFYFSTWTKIKKRSGGTTTVLTGGNAGCRDGALTHAEFRYAYGIDVRKTATLFDLYAADITSHNVRYVDITNNQVTTILGSCSSTITSGWRDGAGAQALIKSPKDAERYSSAVYIVATGNHAIRKIDISSNEVTTFAGVGGTSGCTSKDGIGRTACFNTPSRLAIDEASGDLYLCDDWNANIRKVKISSAEVTTVAGSTPTGYQDGPLLAAKFTGVTGLEIENSKSPPILYLGEWGNSNIRALDLSTGQAYTTAGISSTGTAIDGSGSLARFSRPWGIFVKGPNDVYVADEENKAIRYLSSAVTITASAFNIPSACIDHPTQIGSTCPV